MADLITQVGATVPFYISLDVHPEATWVIRARIAHALGQPPIIDRTANVDPDAAHIRIPWTDEDLASLEPGTYGYDVTVTTDGDRFVSTAGRLRVV